MSLFSMELLVLLVEEPRDDNARPPQNVSPPYVPATRVFYVVRERASSKKLPHNNTSALVMAVFVCPSRTNTPANNRFRGSHGVFWREFGLPSALLHKARRWSTIYSEKMTRAVKKRLRRKRMTI